MMLLFAISLVLVSEVAMQEIGDIPVQQLIGLTFGNAMMSSCCVVRDLRCPTRKRHAMTPFQNSTASELTEGVERFSRCVCKRRRRCTLDFPKTFLPNGASGVKFDMTAVTTGTTAKYTCTYRGSQSLVCQYRTSMSTGLMSWLMPGLTSSGGGGEHLGGNGYGGRGGGGGGWGALGFLGSLGLLGEELEEATEQMGQLGIPPPQLTPATGTTCRRCVPLTCAVGVSRQMTRLRMYTRRQAASGEGRQRYHQCLRRNRISPPRGRPPPATITTTTPSSQFFLRPMTPPPDSLPPSPTPRPATPKPPTTKRPPTVTTTRRTTTSLPTPTTRRTTPGSVLTTLGSGNNDDVDTTSGRVTTDTSGKDAVISPDDETTPPSPKTSATTRRLPTTTTTTPQVITRILVGSASGITPGPSNERMADLMSAEEVGSAESSGGGEVVAVVMGVTVVMAAVFAFLLLVIIRRRRRQRQEKELADHATPPSLARHLHVTGQRGKHSKARPLPSVSSKKAVIDTEDADDEFDKDVDYDGDNDSSEAEESSSASAVEERYTRPPALTPLQKAALAPVKTCSPVGSSTNNNDGNNVHIDDDNADYDDDENPYASVDDTAIIPPHEILPSLETTRAAGCRSPNAGTTAQGDTDTYYNLNCPGRPGLSEEDSQSAKYYNLSRHDATESLTANASKDCNPNRPENDGLSDRGKSKHYNLKDPDISELPDPMSNKYYNTKPSSAQFPPGIERVDRKDSHTSSSSGSSDPYDRPHLHMDHLYTPLNTDNPQDDDTPPQGRGQQEAGVKPDEPRYVQAPSTALNSPTGSLDNVYSEPYGSLDRKAGNPLGSRQSGQTSTTGRTSSSNGQYNLATVPPSLGEETGTVETSRRSTKSSKSSEEQSSNESVSSFAEKPADAACMSSTSSKSPKTTARSLEKRNYSTKRTQPSVSRELLASSSKAVSVTGDSSPGRLHRPPLQPPAAASFPEDCGRGGTSGTTHGKVTTPDPRKSSSSNPANGGNVQRASALAVDHDGYLVPETPERLQRP